MIFVNYVYDPDLSTPEELLDNYFGLTGWVNGLKKGGVQVAVFQRFRVNDYLRVEGGEYYFIQDNIRPRLKGYQIPLLFHRNISKYITELISYQKEIIVLVHGLIFPLQTLHLCLSVSRECRVIVQHHAENPKIGFRRIIQKVCLRPVDGFMFSTQDHAKIWMLAGILHRNHLIGEIMELSSNLRYGDRISARKQTGIYGNPILLWTGNLNQNKDPITILEGLKKILESEPYTRLYMAYRYDDLLSEVKEYINSSEMLMNAVSLLGRIPYSEIESFYNSADFFVQGSHKESCGIALLDALACGVVPIVTDIPSFRVMTDNGRIGALWPVGDSQAFVNAYLSLVHRPIDEQSLEARNQFESYFSFEKLGEQASAFYKKVYVQKPRLSNY